MLSTNPTQSLTDQGVHVTKPRVEVFQAVFSKGHRHFAAQDIVAELAEQDSSVSVATVYNTLRALTEAGLLRRLPVFGHAQFFDTNTTAHSHVFDEATQQIVDIPQAVRDQLATQIGCDGRADLVVVCRKCVNFSPVSETDFHGIV